MRARASCLVAVACLAVLAALVPQTSATRLHVRTDTNRIVDDNGREVVYHGTNVVVKGFPYVPRTDTFNFQWSFVEQDAAFLNDLGLNAIRLGVMWPGAEPTRGAFNETYFSELRKIVTLCNAYNISVLLDMHQDTFSEKFCGEGVPLWAAEPEKNNFPEPLAKPYAVDNSTGLPSPADCSKKSWTEYYFTSALGSAAQRLYKNHDGLLDEWAAFWRKVASTFASYNNILGYELINEPWSGDAVADPLLMVPGVADRVNLEPAYKALHAAIRQADEQTLVFFEGVTWDDVLVGFEDVERMFGQGYRNRSVLAYHYYEPPNFGAANTLATREREARRLACGWFCTETDNADFSNFADPYFQSHLRWEYKAYVPMTGWNYGFWNANGTLNPQYVSESSRTYARAIAGHGVHMAYNTSTFDFSLTYTMDLGCKLPTEIYGNARLHYPKGMNITVLPVSATHVVQPSPNIVLITPTDAAAQGLSVTVTITPR